MKPCVLLLCDAMFVKYINYVTVYYVCKCICMAGISIGGGRVGPGRAMPDQKYGPEIFNDVIIINNNQLIN